MEDSNFSVVEAKRSIDEEGYLELQSSGVGDRVAALEQDGFSFWTEDGLEFCRRNVLSENVGTNLTRHKLS